MTDPITPEGNPQGKGLVPVLAALDALRPWQPGQKSGQMILRDFCLSALVLSARFDFRVVPNKTYYLYHGAKGWQLSLIAPEEWGERLPGTWVACCDLRTDMTWDVMLAPDIGADDQLVSALETHLRGFVARLEEAPSLEQALPVYEQHLPYQQRMMATALSSSLQTSLLLSGLSGQSGQAWLRGDSLRNLLLHDQSGSSS
jgi:hypothetical protein